jgi:hypothetical protein
MQRTSGFFISLLFILTCSFIRVKAQDTIPMPLKINVGLEVSGPIKYFSDKNIQNTEAYFSIDLDEKRSAFFSAGHLNYEYSQNNYTYLNKGSFVRIGMDFNMLKPDKSLGKYWLGIGLRYGLSRFNSSTPTLYKLNYWGTTTYSLPNKTYWGHFVEVSPGVRAEIFKYFSIGWSVSLRMLLYTGTGKDLRPVYFPGFGNGTKTVSTAMSYYIVLNIPYKRINAIIKKEAPEENDDTKDTGTTNNTQQGNGIRQ